MVVVPVLTSRLAWGRGGEGGGGVTPYICYSTNVRAEQPPFQNCQAYD